MVIRKSSAPMNSNVIEITKHEAPEYAHSGVFVDIIIMMGNAVVFEAECQQFCDYVGPLLVF